MPRYVRSRSPRPSQYYGYYLPYWWWLPPPPPPSGSDCVELCNGDADTVYNSLQSCRNKLGAIVAKMSAGVMLDYSAEDIVNLAQECADLADKIYNALVPPFVPSTVQVTDDWIVNRLMLLPSYNPDRRVALDGTYYTVSLEDFKRIITWDRTNKHRYYEDRFDCDKYAMYFKANVAWYFGINAVAVVVDNSASHAYNLLFPADATEPYIYDPTNNDYLAPLSERDTSKYVLKDYVVIV